MMSQDQRDIAILSSKNPDWIKLRARERLVAGVTITIGGRELKPFVPGDLTKIGSDFRWTAVSDDRRSKVCLSNSPFVDYLIRSTGFTSGEKRIGVSCLTLEGGPVRSRIWSKSTLTAEQSAVADQMMSADWQPSPPVEASRNDWVAYAKPPRIIDMDVDAFGAGRGWGKTETARRIVALRSGLCVTCGCFRTDEELDENCADCLKAAALAPVREFAEDLASVFESVLENARLEIADWGNKYKDLIKAGDEEMDDKEPKHTINIELKGTNGNDLEGVIGIEGRFRASDIEAVTGLVRADFQAEYQDYKDREKYFKARIEALESQVIKAVGVSQGLSSRLEEAEAEAKEWKDAVGRGLPGGATLRVTALDAGKVLADHARTLAKINSDGVRPAFRKLWELAGADCDTDVAVKLGVIADAVRKGQGRSDRVVEATKHGVADGKASARRRCWEQLCRVTGHSETSDWDLVIDDVRKRFATSPPAPSGQPVAINPGEGHIPSREPYTAAIQNREMHLEIMRATTDARADGDTSCRAGLRNELNLALGGSHTDLGWVALTSIVKSHVRNVELWSNSYAELVRELNMPWDPEPGFNPEDHKKRIDGIKTARDLRDAMVKAQAAAGGEPSETIQKVASAMANAPGPVKTVLDQIKGAMSSTDPSGELRKLSKVIEEQRQRGDLIVGVDTPHPEEPPSIDAETAQQLSDAAITLARVVGVRFDPDHETALQIMGKITLSVVALFHFAGSVNQSFSGHDYDRSTVRDWSLSKVADVLAQSGELAQVIHDGQGEMFPDEPWTKPAKRAVAMYTGWRVVNETRAQLQGGGCRVAVAVHSLGLPLGPEYLAELDWRTRGHQLISGVADELELMVRRKLSLVSKGSQ